MEAGHERRGWSFKEILVLNCGNRGGLRDDPRVTCGYVEGAHFTGLAFPNSGSTQTSPGDWRHRGRRAL